MRLIDANKLRKDVLELPDCPNGYSDTYDKSMILALIDEAPTVDAVPVIRCKDCKYYREDGDCWHKWYWDNNDERIYYQSVINEPNPDDYCSRAERKEE